MTTVTFLQPYPPYNANERAQFDDAVAAQLCARGLCRVHTPAMPPKAAPPTADAPKPAPPKAEAPKAPAPAKK